MTTTESDIIHERGDFYVCRVGVGHYEVRRNAESGTHSRVVGWADFPLNDAGAQARAIEMCDMKAAPDFKVCTECLCHMHADNFDACALVCRACVSEIESRIEG